jgi:hypothetical protein
MQQVLIPGNKRGGVPEGLRTQARRVSNPTTLLQWAVATLSLICTPKKSEEIKRVHAMLINELLSKFRLLPLSAARN